ncbi:MAG: hypothetical protein WC223_13425 [Bacteroidales bacterium]|jgi:DNA-directed RNA polymerase specialized sigma24 family protein
MKTSENLRKLICQIQLLNSETPQEKENASKAFTKLMSKRKYISSIENITFSFCRKREEPSMQGSDFAQEILLKIYYNLHQFPEHDYNDEELENKFTAWIKRVSINHMIDDKRKKDRIKMASNSFDVEDKDKIDKKSRIDNYVGYDNSDITNREFFKHHKMILSFMDKNLSEKAVEFLLEVGSEKAQDISKERIMQKFNIPTESAFMRAKNRAKKDYEKVKEYIKKSCI